MNFAAVTFVAMVLSMVTIEVTFAVNNGDISSEDSLKDENVLMNKYRGYSVYRVIPRTENQLKFLRQIQEDYSTYTSPFDVEFWKSSCCVHGIFDVMVNRKASQYVLKEIESYGMTPQLLMPDVGGVIKEQMNWTETAIIEGRAGEDYFTIFRTLDEIYRYMEVLRDLSDENAITTIGSSSEGRPLKVLKIGDSANKSIVWLDGGTHAREWIGHATAMYIAARLATMHQSCVASSGSCSESDKMLFNKYTFWIEPVVNPDGYVYSHQSDRLWRKTRSTTRVVPWGVFCTGTDPNRNYDAGWGGEGSSGNPCSQTYAGHSPHSEPEVKSLTDLVYSMRKRIAFFLSLHSYSQIMLLPYGFSKDIPTEYGDLEQLALIGAEVIKNHGTEYRVGSAARILYIASGTASDWAFRTAGIKYSYTFELPDTGEYGFLLPPEKIKPVGEETFQAFYAMVTSMS